MIPPPILDTTCTADQLMGATKAVSPMVWDAIVTKYDSEPGWVQGGVIFHLNRLLQKTPDQRQAEIDTLATFAPNYVPLFVMAEPVAEEITAKCPGLPAQDPTVWTGP